MSALGEKRLAEWRSQPPFLNHDGLFLRRLAIETCSPEALAYLLVESPEALKSRVPTPEWLKETGNALDPFISLPPMPEFSEDDPCNAVFLIPFEPLIQKTYAKFTAWAEHAFSDRNSRPFEAGQVASLFYSSLRRRLPPLVVRTLTLELHVARIKGLLVGETPEERFASFAQHLKDPVVSSRLLDEYPVLLRLVANALSQWFETSSELVVRLINDWPDIQEAFQVSDSSAMVRFVASGLGDRHRGGRTVAVLSFSSGFRLVYKPRSLNADQSFQKLLKWTGRQTATMSFKTLNVLDRKEYGWAEFAENKPCRTKEDLQLFYRRQGGYLALLYILGATDFHYENLIAFADHPILIDLETLFTPRVQIRDLTPAYSDQAGALFASSVLGTSLLPRYTNLGNGIGADDASGLGAVPDRLSRIPELTLDRRGTDEMAIVKRQIRLPGGKNRPQLEGTDIRLLDFKPEITDGFKEVYNAIAANLSGFRREVEESFKDAHVRTVLRATRSYARLFLDTTHPNALRDGLTRAKMLDWLWHGVTSTPSMEQVVPFEIQDLARGDIPYFFTTPDSYDLTTSSGKKIDHFFEKSGFDVFYERLASIGPDDLERQLWIVKSTLAAPEMTQSDHLLRKTHVAPSDPALKNSEWFLELAIEAGERLGALAFETAGRIEWMGLKYKQDLGHFAVEPVDYNLYNGHAGIALFLGYLGLIGKRPVFTELASKSSRTMLSLLDATPTPQLLHGAFEGWGGVVYSLTHLGFLWDSSDLLEQAEKIALKCWRAAESLPTEEINFDIIGGLAGCIGALLSLNIIRPKRDILAVANRCGELLVSSRVEMKRGIGWINPQVAEEPLSGFSHGNAGVAWALMNLFRKTGNELFRTTALEALAFEDGLYDQRTGNWAPRESSLEAGPDSPSLMAWCHGAPGIILSRLPFLSEPAYSGLRANLDTAAATILRERFEASHCLCHGDLGNLDCLLELARAREDRELLREVGILGSELGERVRKDGWMCGIPKSTETPGLMVGIAGIGYEFLRLAAADSVPSVLSLSAPSAPDSARP